MVLLPERRMESEQSFDEPCYKSGTREPAWALIWRRRDLNTVYLTFGGRVSVLKPD
jgi:hypothetical protein